MSNHTTFYFVSTCDLQISMKNKARKFVCRNVCDTQTLGQTVIYISKYLTKEHWEKRPWAKHPRTRGINNGVLCPYTVRLMHHQNEITLWISLGLMWICPYHLSHFFSINVWECVQLSTKKVLFHRPERTEGRLIYYGVPLMIHYSWADEYGSEMS
jgi:hypothetical protein